MSARSDVPTVDRLDVRVYTVPTDAPEGDGTLTWDSTTMVLVQAIATDGTTGIGWTYSAPAVKPLIDDVLAPVVVGSDPMAVTGSWTAMVRAIRNLGRPGIVSTALAAVDTALWDLKARLLGLPLVTLLGQVHAAVAVYGSGGFTTYDEAQLQAQLERWLGWQLPDVKIKIGESWGAAQARDLARVRQAREVIGPDVGLFVDANGGYSVGQAVRVGQRLAEQNVIWFEEPVSSDHLAGLAHVRTAVLPDVTAGEYGYDLTYFARMCAAGAVDCLQVDVSRCGGITEWLRVAAVAASYGLQVSGHCAPTLHVPVAAATPNLRHLEYFHDHVRLEEMLFDGTLDPTGGKLRPDLARTGNGLTLREGDAERWRVS